VSCSFENKRVNLTCLPNFSDTFGKRKGYLEKDILKNTFGKGHLGKRYLEK
jgi:hypothetical protein